MRRHVLVMLGLGIVHRCGYLVLRAQRKFSGSGW